MKTEGNITTMRALVRIRPTRSVTRCFAIGYLAGSGVSTGQGTVARKPRYLSDEASQDFEDGFAEARS